MNIDSGVMFGNRIQPARDARMSLSHRTLAILAVAMGCSEAEAPPQRTDATPDATASTEASAPGRSYERILVFLSAGDEEPLLLPWRFESRTRPGGVDRIVEAALYSGTAWETFFEATWESPPSRAPWRLVPHDRMGLVVEENDQIANLLFREPPNELDLAVGNELVDWSGPRGEEVRVAEGALVVGGAETTGSVVDLSRNWRPAERLPGDWIVLVSGDSVHLVLEGETEGGGVPYRGWGRVDDRELQWPNLELSWDGVRSYEPARRDVPDMWTFASEEQELTGTLQVVSSQLRVGEGEGPQLPVDAHFTVSGTITLLGAEYPVWGLARHGQP